jgi:hypothetical protein
MLYKHKLSKKCSLVPQISILTSSKNIHPAKHIHTMYNIHISSIIATFIVRIFKCERFSCKKQMMKGNFAAHYASIPQFL